MPEIAEATPRDANQVALEAGNSLAIIFRHYRELVTEAAATAWFGIVPPDGWVPPEEKRQRRRKVKDRAFDLRDFKLGGHAE